MKSNLKIIIDAGTSNTRIKIYEGFKKKKERKDPFGVKIGKEKFIKKLEENILLILEENNLEINDIDFIIASGMITSKLGLFEVEHLKLPLNINQIHKKIVVKIFLGLPIYLIPGLKLINENFLGSSFDQSDVIRGEEVEIVGMLEHLKSHPNLILILPGSHNKFVEIEENKIIKSFSSTLSGEILNSLIKNTILSNSITGYENKLNLEFLNLGFKRVNTCGITEAAFNLRGIDISNSLNNVEKFSYLLGVVLGEDIKSLKSKGILSKKIVILGENIISLGLYELLKNETKKNQISIIEIPEISAIGAIKLVNKFKENVHE